MGTGASSTKTVEYAAESDDEESDRREDLRGEMQRHELRNRFSDSAHGRTLMARIMCIPVTTLLFSTLTCPLSWYVIVSDDLLELSSHPDACPSGCPSLVRPSSRPRQRWRWRLAARGTMRVVVAFLLLTLRPAQSAVVCRPHCAAYS